MPTLTEGQIAQLRRAREFAWATLRDLDELLHSVEPDENYRTPPPQYSAATKIAHGELIECWLGSKAPEQMGALVALAKSVHCDLTGELRLPHRAPTEPDEPKQG